MNYASLIYSLTIIDHILLIPHLKDSLHYRQLDAFMLLSWSLGIDIVY